MKKIRMKLMSGFISMIMMVNLIAPVGVYASVVNDDETVIEETVTQEDTEVEETLNEQMTTTSGDETEKNDEDIQQEETDEVTPTGTVEENTETETSSPFSESKTIGDVTITVKAEAGAFPNDSYLEVKEIASNTDMSSENETLVDSYSYDITIYDKDGNEIEPAEGKNVTVSFSMDRIADSNLDTNIYHTSDDGTVTELDITTKGDTATATTDSFSVYTVEFTYGELTYVMNGDSSIKLSDILSSVGLTGQATNVECSDTSLFSASNESGEWIISSHKAFSTTEWMKVTIEDIVYEIKVTDAQTGTCGTNVTWTLDGDTLTISGTGAMADYSALNDIPWYSQKASITTVVISDGVTSIGKYAIAMCANLTSVTIPDSVTSIGESAFAECGSLTSITIPASVTSIDYGAFYYCDNLTSITIPSGVTSIGDQVFQNCSNLTSITIPNGVTSIGDYAFAACTGLTSITIPDSVTSIGNYAFFYCISLSSITIPASVNSIGSYAFANIANGAVIYYEGTQTDLDKVTGKNNIPSPKLKLRSEGGNCGANGDNVKWSYYDDGTLVISGTGAMANYNAYIDVPWYSQRANIKNVVISDGVTSIGDVAFNYCTNLTSITIPNSVTSIGDYAFYECTGLTSITIPSGVTSIGDGAFAYNRSLTSITIPSGVTSIGNGAFAVCSALTSITIPSGVTSIGDVVFAYNRSLTSITIPASVNSIGTGAFDDIASNAVIDFGGTQAQWDSFGVTLATTVTVRCALLAAGNCGANGDNVKWLLKNDGTLEISGSGDMANYNDSNYVPWYSQRANIKNVVISDGVTSIGDYAFSQCTNLSSITIPASVTSIGVQAFAACSGLTGITIPNSVTSIGDQAFYLCFSLSNITISNSVTSIGNSAFASCTSLSSLTIPAGVTSIGVQAFRNCSGLTSITIPASVTSIGVQAFLDMGKNATDPTINFGGTKEKWDAFPSNISVGSNVKVNYTPINITIKAKNQSVNAGTSIQNNVNQVEITSGSLATGHTLEGITLTADTTNKTITPKDAVIKSGTTTVDIAGNYNITYADGTLTVTKKDLTITADSDSKTYDGTALTKNSYTNTALAAGDHIESVTITGSQTVAGTSNNVPSSAVIKNASNVDVTANYNITYTNGTLEITKRNVTVSVIDKIVSYNANEQKGSTLCTFTNIAAGDTATITYIPSKGTDASATAYNNGSFADDFKVMHGSSDVTASYNLTTKTAGKLTINKAAITPTVTIKGWIVGNTPDIPTVTGNKGKGTETIEYKKSTEADAAYTGTVPTAEGTYTVRATIDETANYQGATATAEFKISAKPVVVTEDDSDKKDNEEPPTPPENDYEKFMKELRAAAKKGTAQTLVLNWGNSLSYEAMQILKDNPQLTLIFNFKWQGVDYSTTIGGGRTVYADKTIPWYGPECLMGRYGATRGRVYVNRTGNAVTGTVNASNNGVYVVQSGDSLWKIANRKLHVSVDYLVKRNNIVNRNRIRTGQVIYY